MLQVQTYQSLDDLPEGYRRLFESAAVRSIFLSLPWFLNFVATVPSEDERVCIYGVEATDPQRTPLGALVMRRQFRRTIGPVTLSGMANYYTSLFGPIIDSAGPDCEQVIGALVRALCAAPPPCDVIDLHPLDPDQASYRALIQAFKAEGWIVQTYFCHGNWYLDVAGRSFAEYFATLPSVLKKNIPYMQRKLERTGHVKIEVFLVGDRLEKALEDFETVYMMSWRSQAEPYPEFVRGLARTAMENGWLRMGLLYLDDVPMAAQIWFVHGGVASIFKICYAEWFTKLSVGTILSAHMMQYVLDTDKVREVDYLSGDDAYKKDWMSHRRERWGMIALNPRTVGGLLAAVKHVGGRMLKRLWQGPNHWQKHPRSSGYFE